MLNPKQFQYELSYEPAGDDAGHKITATDKKSGAVAGWLEWGNPSYRNDSSSGRLEHVLVEQPHRGTGLATLMWNHAKTISGAPRPEHSEYRTPEGDRWAKTTGDFVPTLDQDALEEHSGWTDEEMTMPTRRYR